MVVLQPGSSMSVASLASFFFFPKLLAISLSGYYHTQKKLQIRKPIYAHLLKELPLLLQNPYSNYATREVAWYNSAVRARGT